MKRALVNALLGDGHFWRHPESINSNIVWTSISKDWLKWKQKKLIPEHLKSRLRLVRKANAIGCYPNSKPLYELKTFVHPAITEAHDSWSKTKAIGQMDMLDLAVWYIDDGSAIVRKDTKTSYRIMISVGALSSEELFPAMSKLLGMSESSLGRVVKNNSRATERNKTWVMTKAAAVQVLKEARLIAPREYKYKVPLW